jgi:hypothetical protein
MRRAQKRRNRPGGGGSGKAKSWTGPAADHTLQTLLRNYLDLPTGNTVFINGQVYMSEDALLYVRAIVAREKELGGKRAIEAALDSLLPGGAR